MTRIDSDDWRIVTERVRMMPQHVTMHIGSYGKISKQSMLDHLEKKDEVGKRIVEMQLNYLRYFSRHMQSVANG